MDIIYISGIDGCGKTTQSELLVEWLQARGQRAEYQWLRWEPSIVPLLKRLKSTPKKQESAATSSAQRDARRREDQSHGKWRKIKSLLMSSALFRKLWLRYATNDYYAAYRKASSDWRSNFVVMDRYITDFVIDQAINFSMKPMEFIDFTRTTAIAKMQQPVYSILIAIPADVGYERKLDGTPLQYLRERESLYSGLALENTLHVNGEQTVEKIHQDITDWLATKLGLNHGK